MRILPLFASINIGIANIRLNVRLNFFAKDYINTLGNGSVCHVLVVAVGNAKQPSINTGLSGFLAKEIAGYKNVGSALRFNGENAGH